MTAGERGFLLLSSHLGDPGRHPLTTAQLRQLALRVQAVPKRTGDRDLIPDDLKELGYGAEEARRIVSLLEQEDVLEHYLRKGKRLGCGILTRVSEAYPQALRRRLGADAPGVLWYKGSLSILTTPMAALVGSRDIHPGNEAFAAEAGRQAAKQGFTLVSGNARGADRIAQDAALEAGGKVISVLADALAEHEPLKNQLLLSEDSFDLGFTPQRALSRNRVIHALPRLTLVAQVTPRSGGTWDGTLRNLRGNWSPVFCYDDHSEGAAQLELLGAETIGIRQLSDLEGLARRQIGLFRL